MKKLLCVLVALMMLCAGLAEPMPLPMAEGDRVAGLERLEALPRAQWQYTFAFPDWKDYVDNTLAMNGMVSFRFYHGQGTIYLEVAEGVTGFNLYVNGVKFDMSGVTGGLWSADISAAATDGVNTLQITNIRPADMEKAVAAHIPYPVVLPGDPEGEGIDPETLALIGDIVGGVLEMIDQRSVRDERKRGEKVAVMEFACVFSEEVL